MLYENIADHDWDARAASDSSVTFTSESSDCNNPEPGPERVRRSRGGESTNIEVAA